MSPEAQRIAIAEACGWREIKTFTGSYHTGGFHPTKPKWRERLPDYLSDLNAMHEAEKNFLGLNVEHHRRYEAALTNISGGLPWRATAAQRAEAFLRALNLWKDSPAD